MPISNYSFYILIVEYINSKSNIYLLFYILKKSTESIKEKIKVTQFFRTGLVVT